MKGGKIIVLAVAAIALCIVGIIAYKQQNSTEDKGAGQGRARGAQLLPELGKRAGDIARIEVTTPKSSDSIVLERDENNDWSVTSTNGYPADPSKPGKLLMDLTDIKVSGRLTNNPEKYSNFGFTDDQGEKCAIVFKDKAGKLVTRVIFGGERKAGGEEEGAPAMGGGRYMRVSGDPYVYQAQESLYWVDTNITNWVNTEIMSVPQTDVTTVSIDSATTESFTANWASGTAEIDHPDGVKVKDYEMDNTRGALAGLRLANVMPADSPKAAGLALENKATYTACSKDGVIYAAQLGQAGDKRYIRLSASEGEPFYSIADQASTTALAAAREKADKRKETVAAFNKRHAPWLYELDSWNYDKLTKKRSAVTEPKTEAKEEKTEAKAPRSGDLATTKPKSKAVTPTPKTAVRSDDKKTTKTLTKDTKTPAAKPEVKSSPVKPEAKPSPVKPEAKPSPAKPEVKPLKPEVKPEVKPLKPEAKPSGAESKTGKSDDKKTAPALKPNPAGK